MVVPEVNIFRMDSCFQCGGKLRSIAKPGRMVLGVDDDELYEIPAELKIPTCLDCGWLFEEEVWLKIQRAIEAQKKCAPGFRVDMLRFIDKDIRNILAKAPMYGGHDAIELTVLSLLRLRSAIVYKCKIDGSAQNSPMQHYLKFLKKHFPKTLTNDLTTEFHKLDLVDEFAPLLSEFCDVWVNAVI